MTITRISVTIDDDLVSAADARARELDRSRSWLVSEAVRRFLSAPSVAYGAGLGASRQAQLEADLTLTPEERVREAERTLEVDAIRRRAAPPARVLTFDRFEDYLAWDKAERVKP